MLDVMCPLITEADSVSQELLDIILINIIEPHKVRTCHVNPEFESCKSLLHQGAECMYM